MYIMGIDPTSTSSTPLVFPGTLGAISPAVTLYTAPMSQTGSTGGSNPGDAVYMYVRFTTAVTVAGSVVTVDNTFNAAPTTAAMAAATNIGKTVGVAKVTQVINNYGWVQVYGVTSIIAAATGSAIGSGIFAAATAGQVNATAAANVRIDGIILTAIPVSNLAAAFLNWPRVGGTTALA